MTVKIPDDVNFFANLLASFANVFVGPKPTDMGIPVHLSTF
jgi:hypothetical protein